MGSVYRRKLTNPFLVKERAAKEAAIHCLDSSSMPRPQVSRFSKAVVYGYPR